MRASAVLSGYGAAKAGLNALVRSIAVEFGASNVRANAIAPAVVRTGFSQDLWRHPERERALVARIPAKRLADPEDIVGTAILLASPAGSYISGQVLVVDGGWTISQVHSSSPSRIPRRGGARVAGGGVMSINT